MTPYHTSGENDGLKKQTTNYFALRLRLVLGYDDVILLFGDGKTAVGKHLRATQRRIWRIHLTELR